jgi:PQQ-dependent dehydrogenase (methanol/ethanol family)
VTNATQVARRWLARALVAAGLVVGFVALPGVAQQGPTQAELNAAASNASDWLLPNHDYGGQRFVELAQIARQNATSMRPVCAYEIGGIRPFHTNPIVYRGVMYLTTSHATVALDAATCRVRWRHDWVAKARENWPQSRGVAFKEGKIVRGTLDGYLLAIDAESGRLLWERPAANADIGETFTMPPVIFEDLVIAGPAGNEVPINGWVGAFRLDDGKPVWRFNTRPKPGEPGAETWSATNVLTGGGAVWTPFSLDTTNGLLYVPVGNPAPDLYTDVRRGDNLYTNSMVVLDVRSGKLVWHYQAVPKDFHDWDLTQTSPLFSAEVNGARRQLVAVVGKDGLLHVLDRDTRAHVYQVPVTRRENVDVPLTSEGVYACPGVLGGVQWNGPAFNPRTNALYVNSVEWCGVFRKAETLQHFPGRNYMGGRFSPDPIERARGWLTAVDASTGAIRWRYAARRPMLAAIAATSADLLFTGDLDGTFLVLDARDGTVLHRLTVPGPMNGGVVTYQTGGRQYVAATSGSATYFWGAMTAQAAVTIFAIPLPGP